MLINTEKQITDKNYITKESNKSKICLYSSNLPGLSSYDYLLFKNWYYFFKKWVLNPKLPKGTFKRGKIGTQLMVWKSIALS